ncbi:MAG: LCP family protein [Oscillospiraceae bacterium]|jgi:LCP family protein required for cell wall assembly|nr:LCP family protein [Oscillospiraceae bacterium]
MSKKPFDFDKEDDDFLNDPYEKGFSDKLYLDEEYEEEGFSQAPPAPAIRAYNADFNPPQPRRQAPRKDAAYDPRPYEEFEDEETEDDDEQDAPPPKKRKKKHGFFRKLLKVLLVFLILFALLIAALLIFAQQPTADDSHSLGARKSGVSTILVVGTDKGGSLTDTIMLMNFNRSEKRISVMSIPRDTKVNSKYTPHKINGAYGANGKGAEGMDSLMTYVSHCVGFYPDGYILVELDVFLDLVNLMGNVEFDVPQNMYYEDPAQGLSIALESGLQKLNAVQAMGLVRFRSGYSAADLRRVEVQRDFVAAAFDQWASVKNVWKLPSAAIMLSKNSQSDMNIRNLSWLAMSAAICGTDDMQMMTIPYYMDSGGYVLVDSSVLDVVNAYFNPYERDITMDDLYLAR